MTSTARWWSRGDVEVDLPQFGQVGGGLSQQHPDHAGIVSDGGKRLSELVGNRRRQLPYRRAPVHMGQFHHALLGVPLRLSPSAMLIQEADEQSAHRDQKSGDGHDLPLIPLPRGRHTEQHRAVRGKSESLISQRLSSRQSYSGAPRLHRRGADSRGALAREQARGGPGGRTALVFAGDQRSTHDSLAQIGIGVAEHGRIRGTAQLRERRVLIQGNPVDLR